MEQQPKPPVPLSAEARALIVEHFAWAKRVARQIAMRGYRAETSDVESAVMAGLVDAARLWRPDGGKAFRWFAYIRIRGAVADMKRKQDIYTRDERLHMKRGTVFRGGVPGKRAIISEDIGDLESEDDPRLHAHLPDQLAAFERCEILFLINDAIRRLPPKHAEVVRQHFFEGKWLADIGRSMGFTESRACQISREGVAMLAAMFRDEKDCA